MLSVFILFITALTLNAAQAGDGCDPFNQDVKTMNDHSHSLSVITSGGHLETISSSISKETLEKIRTTATGGKETFIWNHYLGSPVLLIPTGNPKKDCSSRSKQLHTLQAGCNRVDLSRFTADISVLYDDSAEKCKRIYEITGKSDPSIEEMKQLTEDSKKLGERSGNRSPAIIEVNTRVAGKDEPKLEIGTSAPEKETKQATPSK